MRVPEVTPTGEVEEMLIIENFSTATMSESYPCTPDYRRQVSHVTLEQVAAKSMKT